MYRLHGHNPPFLWPTLSIPPPPGGPRPCTPTPTVDQVTDSGTALALPSAPLNLALELPPIWVCLLLHMKMCEGHDRAPQPRGVMAAAGGGGESASCTAGGTRQTAANEDITVQKCFEACHSKSAGSSLHLGKHRKQSQGLGRRGSKEAPNSRTAAELLTRAGKNAAEGGC